MHKVADKRWDIVSVQVSMAGAMAWVVMWVHVGGHGFNRGSALKSTTSSIETRSTQV